jgi:hypothetical protein
MTSTPNLYPVRLSGEQRERLQALTRQGATTLPKRSACR